MFCQFREFVRMYCNHAPYSGIAVSVYDSLQTYELYIKH